MRVYLSGGMKSGWQNIVKEKCPNLYFIDPSKHELSSPSQYTLWDLEGVKHCDIVFAYMELDNPSGIGLSLEIGYAKALGKTVILVDAKMDARMQIVRETADIVFPKLEYGIDFLKSFERM